MDRDEISGLPPAVAQILGPDGEVAGAGFLVAEGVLVTCAHVVRGAGSGPGECIRLAFPHAAGAPLVEGQVLDGPWRAPEAEDVAIVRLSGTPAGMYPLPLGSASGCRGHQVRSFGFPAQAPPDGHFGFGVAGDLLPATERRGSHLQLTAANDLTTGFSGGPVLDEVTGLVIGMLAEITAPDEHERGQGVAYVTPTQVLREIWPGLAEQDVCPYRGLETFTAEHARWFEGRNDAVEQVLANLARQQRLTLLLGPSGSGKSSLIQAGVLRALAAGALPGSDRWLPVLARPRQDLPAELEGAGLAGAATDGIAAAVTRILATQPGHQGVLLVIDQFEELLTRSDTDPAVADRITDAVTSSSELRVVLIMRDDFYPRLAALAPRLLEAAMPGLLNVPGTLSRQDLHDIITLPTQDVGLHFQAGLPEQIISDVLAATPEGAAARQAPVTVLPLLELTLSQLWQRRHDGYLTHQAYRRIGGVTGSLTTWCDTALNQLSANQRPIAQRILTSLVRPADPGRAIPTTRALIPLAELRDLAAGPDAACDGDDPVDEVIAVLTRHRIVTTQTLRTPEHPDATPGLPVAELIHDALIRDWATLRDWVNKDRRFHVWLDRIRIRATHWAANNDPGDLLGGAALAEALEWSQQRRLPGDITAFINISKQRQHAVARRTRRLNTVLAALLTLALITAGIAIVQWRRAASERHAALSALSQKIATQSRTQMSANPDLASLLAIQAYRTSPNPESLESLQTVAARPLQRRLSFHADPVLSVAFSPDGNTLATGSRDDTVRLWNVATGKTPTPLTGHKYEVTSVAFSPDGNTLATSSNDDTVRLWDVATGKTLKTLPHGDPVYEVAFSPDGHTLATGSAEDIVRLWDVSTGKTIRTLQNGHDNLVLAVAFSPKGDTLATGNLDKTVQLWDVASGMLRTTLTGHNDAVLSVAFSPDGNTLATGSRDKTVRLWDIATGKVRTTLSGHTNVVNSVAFNPDGRTLATGSDDDTVRLWDVARGITCTTLAEHTDDVNSVAFSPDGKSLATGSSDSIARLWDVVYGSTHTTLTGHPEEVLSAAFSPDGQTLATGSRDSIVRLWDIATGKVRTELAGHGQVFSVAFSPDGHTLATTGGVDYAVQLWDVATGKVHTTLTKHTGTVWSVAFSPDGRTLATSSSDDPVLLWDVATGNIRTELTGLTSNVWSVAFSPDSRTLATMGNLDDWGSVLLWDVATGKVRTTLSGHTTMVNSVAFSPDGRTLATGSDDKTVRLWDIATGATRATLSGHTTTVTSVAFSPDGHTLATGSDDNTVRLWGVATGQFRTALIGHTGKVNSVAFSPDGRTLATGSLDKTVRLWNVALPRPAAAIQRICGAVNRDLTPQERTTYLPGQSVDPVCPPR
ncbi:trypsin-like peptidase domain-containing protein [Streptomyces sp. KS 21]|uniref:nSTAND1 domain-containing NTPase n=1 Tax=Streptomyces sp. KS 21 TaxID=2485150 RepID=UPI001062D9E6|nr:trypsin-like peptidase domain-containing protein [Streptomyces sp. KS 21]TDU73488.1 ribosome assembly protein 4 (RSA4) [Streptomyces sp. KS 21]